MSGKRRSAGPIRQLSLQHPPSTATRRLLKKQQSMDAERLWTAGNSINGDLALRVTASSFRNSDHFPQDIVNTPKTPAGHAIPIRPRPVKLAWTDRRQQTLQQENQNQLSQNSCNNNNVEVVAKRFMGQPRASAAKSARQNASNLPAIGGDKDSILYTRQQLAERLRRAWKEREASRPNLDIFLAHNSIDNDADDEPSFVDNEADGAPDLRPESVLALSETLSQQEDSVVGSSSPLQKTSSIETTDLVMAKSQLAQNSSNNLMYSSTAIGLSKKLSPQKKIDISNKNNVTSNNFGNIEINDIDNVMSTATLGNCNRSQIKHTDINVPRDSSVNIPNTKSISQEELATKETSHKTAIKLTNINFSVFPRASVIVIPKKYPTNLSSCANKTSGNSSDINNSNISQTTSPLLSQHLSNEDSNGEKNLSEISVGYSEATEKNVIDRNPNKPSQLEKTANAPKQGITSEDNTNTGIDAYPLIEDQKTVEPNNRNISSKPVDEANNCKKNNKEEEFSTNDEDETKENKIISNNKNCYANINNKEVNNDHQPKTLITNKIPNTAEIMTATLRRVNFRNSINKTITGSFASDVPPVTSDVAPVPTAAVANIKKTIQKPTLSRALSAPSQRPSSKPTSVPQPAPTRSILVQRNRRPPLQHSSSVDIPSDSIASTDGGGDDEGYNQVRGDRNIKSAPAKRRIKTAGPRRKSRGRGEGSSGDEAETGAKEEKKSSAPRVGRRGVARGAEIVTMVSLMSDGSDVDADPTDPFLQPAPGAGIAPWLEEKNKWMENPNKQTHNDQVTGGVTPSPPRIVCLRKSPKSVTFQQQPSPSSNSASRTPSAFSASRRVIAVTSTEKESKSSSASATASVRLTSKDPSFQTPETIINCVNTVNEEFPKSKEELVLENAEVQQNNSSNQIPVPDSPATISSENTASMKELPLQKPTTDSNPRNEQEKVPSPSSDVNNLETRRAGHGVAVTGIIKLEPTPPTECADVQESTADAEPEFQSPKERECWQLYRRMVEKGVSVSYDTVLRGMLTPTEYRLRRNALLSTTVRQLV